MKTEEVKSTSDTVEHGFRWRSVLGPVGWVTGVMLVVSILGVADAWRVHLPRGVGQSLTEIFLRSMLVAYFLVIAVFPILLFTACVMQAKFRRSGWRRRIIPVCIFLGSTMFSVLLLEGASAGWLAWKHRMPRLPVDFPKSAADRNELSLVVLGGSSAMGYPYDPYLSIGKIVAWQLEKAVPGRPVALNIEAEPAKNLEDMHKRLAKLERRPDAVIVYSGHNEFLSRYETQRDAGYAEAPRSGLMHRLYRLSLRSPFCQLLYETARTYRLGAPPPRMNQHRLLDAPAVYPSELQERLADFDRRLEAIVTYCDRVGAVPILVIPPANESGFEPNRTVLSAPGSDARQEQLVAAFRHAREVEASDREASIAEYRALIAEEPEFAEAHFRLARLLELAGHYDEARARYVAARDLDGYPVRCRTDFMRIYHEVAGRHGCILVDGPEVLRARSAHGILDDTLFHDAHHPTFVGHLGLAQAVMDRLHERKLLGLGNVGGTAPIIDPSECATRFTVNDKLWSDVAIKAGTYFKQLASARYDTSERLAKSDRYLKAGEDMRAGRARPEETRTPGISLNPPPIERLDWWNVPVEPEKSGSGGSTGRRQLVPFEESD